MLEQVLHEHLVEAGTQRRARRSFTRRCGLIRHFRCCSAARGCSLLLRSLSSIGALGSLSSIRGLGSLGSYGLLVDLSRISRSTPGVQSAAFLFELDMVAPNLIWIVCHNSNRSREQFGDSAVSVTTQAISNCSYEGTPCIVVASPDFHESVAYCKGCLRTTNGISFQTHPVEQCGATRTSLLPLQPCDSFFQDAPHLIPTGLGELRCGGCCGRSTTCVSLLHQQLLDSLVCGRLASFQSCDAPLGQLFHLSKLRPSGLMLQMQPQP
mmetsp:Transcript_61607/g.116516  ORF Transcript_61607/g.116516 Transcript_61607/m.116516 type:complete len:267 (+) Transcript_61607:802-1602(+)